MSRHSLQVCGTDGVTYENICLLRSQSGNGRVDYSGDCQSIPDDVSVEEACSNIREKSKCQFTTENCNRLVRPEEGCCPICGKQLNTTLLPTPYITMQKSKGHV